jgi:hypothetical protein
MGRNSKCMRQYFSTYLPRYPVWNYMLICMYCSAIYSFIFFYCLINLYLRLAFLGPMLLFLKYVRRKFWRFCSNYCKFLLKFDHIINFWNNANFLRRKSRKIVNLTSAACFHSLTFTFALHDPDGGVRHRAGPGVRLLAEDAVEHFFCKLLVVVVGACTAGFSFAGSCVWKGGDINGLFTWTVIFSVGCNSRIQHRTKNRIDPIFCAVSDVAVASDTENHIHVNTH